MVREVDPIAVSKDLAQRPEALVLLDVRETDERAVARIEPSLFIPMQEVPRRLAELPRDRRIVVYCHHGHRSAMVAGYLEREGFDRVENLHGGIDHWAARVDPAMPRY